MHPFIIDDLLNELHNYVKQELQTAGKADIEVETFKYRDDHACRILADREQIRQAFVYLLDNAIKSTDSGFIYFGYYVLDDDLVDFFVDDTGSGNHNDTPPDLSPVRNLLGQMGSRLKEKNTDEGSSFSFSIKSAKVELISG